MDPESHKRYLDYRERHSYFGGQTKLLAQEEFARLDEEHRALDRKPEEERDEDEALRYDELSKQLFRD